MKFYNILLAYADELQAVSVDECLIDVSSRAPRTLTETKEGAMLALANTIRSEIRSSTKCEASIGISHNIILAKLATKQAKPAGSYYLGGSRISQLLTDLQIDDLPGVGWSQKQYIEDTFKVSNVGQLANISLLHLVEAMGPIRGKTLHLYSRGIDDRQLKSSSHDRKSVSAVVNYGIRFQSAQLGGTQQAHVFVKELGAEVSRRLVELGLRGRHLTVKIMKRAANASTEAAKFLGHGVCDELSKATRISGPVDSATDEAELIGKAAWKLISAMKIPPEDLRGIGIQIQKLEKVNADGGIANIKGQSTLSFKPVKLAHVSGGDHAVKRTNGDIGFHVTNEASIQPVVKPVGSAPLASTSKSTIQSSAFTPKDIISNPKELSLTQLDIPPASQIDFEVVNALPTPIRANILNSVHACRRSVTVVTPLNQGKTPTSSYDQLPSASQVDWSVLADLPSSVRKPIEALYEQRKRQKAALPPPPAPNFGKSSKSTVAKQTKVSVASAKTKLIVGSRLPIKKMPSARKLTRHAMGPSQRLISTTSFKLITRPQTTRPEPGADKSSQDLNVMLPSPNRITDEQLEALDIDVRFFRELSSARAFQLDLIYDQYQTHQTRFKEVTAATDRWRLWRKRLGRASKVLSVEPVEGPSLACAAHRKGARAFEDVGQLLEEWVSSLEEQDQIEEGDVSRVERFLIDSVDRKRGSGQDLDKTFKLVVWWEQSVHMQWPELSGLARARWERVIQRVKDVIDEVCEHDHGASLFA